MYNSKEKYIEKIKVRSKNFHRGTQVNKIIESKSF